MISHPQWTTANNNVAAKPDGATAFIIECPTCGYEPDEQLLMRPMRCPKCHRFSWHRIPRPGMLADRLVGQPSFDREEDYDGAMM